MHSNAGKNAKSTANWMRGSRMEEYVHFPWGNGAAGGEGERSVTRNSLK